MDGLANFAVRTTAADVSAHRFVNVGVSGMSGFGQEGGGGHDLAGLAVATLRDILFDPGLLNRVVVEAFDRRDRFASQRRDWGNAGAHRLPIDMDRASATQRHAAAELGAGHFKVIAQHPQEGHGRGKVD